MGYIKHHAIVVTTSNSFVISCHAKATEICGTLVSGLVPSNINGYVSFFVAPDGSKEGWHESNEGDDNRAEFIEWIKAQAYEDGSNSISYAELYYGDDERQSEIVNHN